MTGIKIGNIDITDVGKIKLGNTDIQEVYAGSKKVWPASSLPDDPPEIEIKLLPLHDHFLFKTNSPFTVEQDGIVTRHPAAVRPVTISANDSSPIKINLINNSTTTIFTFGYRATISYVKLNSVGRMTSLASAFTNLYITVFECAADTSRITDFWSTWAGCIELTSFPLIDTSSGTDFTKTWTGCGGLTSFPALNTSSGNIFMNTWRNCEKITSFPITDMSSGIDFNSTWAGCRGLTSFPVIDVNSGINFNNTWGGCTALTSFPALDMSSGTNFNSTWSSCSRLTSFSVNDMSSGIDFAGTWNGCRNLVCIAGTLDFRKLTDGLYAFRSCNALTAPAPHGTPVRAGDNATAGVWTNPNPCGELSFIAEFTGTPVSGEVPLTVVFTDTSTGTPTSWSWDFGDGNTSAVQNPHHTYATDGTYTVTLIVTNTHGSDTKVKNDYITVRPNPADTPIEVEIRLRGAETSFDIVSPSGFTVEQGGVVKTYPVAPTRRTTISGMSDATFIKITLADNDSNTAFTFGGINHIRHVKLNSVGKMTFMGSMFYLLSGMTTFECAADLSKVTYFQDTWRECTGMTSFPAIDTSSGTNFGHAWYRCDRLRTFPALNISKGTSFDSAWAYCSGLVSFPAIDFSSGIDLQFAWFNCQNIVCFEGTLDFSNLAHSAAGDNAFQHCFRLTAPAPAGTPVRDGDNATRGTWTNPNPCP